MGNLKKAVHYARQNGLIDACFVSWERILLAREEKKYEKEFLEEVPDQKSREDKAEELKNWSYRPKISILVPAYETKERFAKELILSVTEQIYPDWELIIAEAGESPYFEECVKEAADERIRYQRLSENLGISGNSNAGLKIATGEYVAFLDHDDLLTPDALFEMVQALQGEDRPVLVYSDEDKCNEEGNHFFSPHKKTDFNLDLFLTNNYLCHFTMVRRDVVAQLGFRKKYDGAQDYDLFLRVVLALCRTHCPDGGLAPGIDDLLKNEIRHVPKVLYHWRCYDASTADNPESKEYAYEAGRRAVEDWYRRMGIRVTVYGGKHLGFYEAEYEDDFFAARPDVGVVGGRIIHKNRVLSGAMRSDGSVIYKGLHKRFQGYLNRAVLQQDAEALDLRCMKVRPELRSLYLSFISRIGKEDVRQLSLEFSKELREKGYFLFYEPTLEKKA